MRLFRATKRVALLACGSILGLSALAASAKQGDRPDLSGTWDFRTTVPLERPDEPPDQAATGGELPVWNDHGTAVARDDRSSLILEPADGKLPAMVEGAETQGPGNVTSGEGDGSVRIRVGGLGTEDPEQRGLSERCLQGFNAGPPIVPGFYNQTLRIVQTDDHVALVLEMIHDARIVTIDGEHSSLDRWLGDSVGHWDGETLVVDTVSFSPKVASFAPSPFVSLGSAAELHLIERLRLLDADTLEYRFTVQDPATFVQPFTAALLMRRTSSRLYEYACHEGNYPLLHILMAARSEEEREADG